MEDGPFEDVFPTINKDFLLLCYFSRLKHPTQLCVMDLCEYESMVGTSPKQIFPLR